MIGLIDVGGTKLLTALGDVAGRVGPVVRRPTPRDGDMAAVLGDMLDEARGSESLTAISAAVPGPFDRDAGALLAPPGLSPSWHGLDLVTAMGQRFDCPVWVENDANCAALAEARRGAGRGAGLVVYFTVSTGIGTGMVRDGELVIQRHDTEGGHQVLWPAAQGGPPCDCGGSGCLEALASGRAIASRFGRAADDLEDQSAWDDVGRWLGIAVVNTVALLDCDRVVFGGGVAAPRWSRLEPALRAAVAEHLHLQPAPDIRLAELGDERNLVGAALLALWHAR